MFKLSPRATLVLLILVLFISMAAAFVLSGLIVPGGYGTTDNSVYVSDLGPNVTPIPGLSPVARLAPTPTPTSTPTEQERMEHSPPVSAREVYSASAKQALNWQPDAVLWDIDSVSNMSLDGRARGWRYRFYSAKDGSSLELRSYEGAATIISDTLSWAAQNYVVPTMTFSIDMVVDSTQAANIANSAVVAKYGADWIKSPDMVIEMHVYKQPNTGLLTWDVSYSDGRRVVVVEVDAVKGTALRLSSNQ